MKTKRNVYLKMKTLSEARKIVDEAFALPDALASETVPTPEAIGRVLAEPIHAKLSSPHFNAAAMDGLAVRAEVTFGANESTPRTLKVGQDAFYVNTGHVMPTATDAVIMIEQVHVLDEDQIQIDKPVFPWQNVRKVFEDMATTGRGHRCHRAFIPPEPFGYTHLCRRAAHRRCLHRAGQKTAPDTGHSNRQ
jgi:putative molybdopterin biosynthesis protein